MKLLQTALLTVMITVLFTSCQQGNDAKQILAKDETRKEIMSTIANDSSMHKEMMTAMMSGDHGKMMGSHASMMKMMKDNPDMMQGMMSGMMEKCKSDSNLCKRMCKNMMENPQMMNMMQKMKGMDTMKNMDHKMHH